MKIGRAVAGVFMMLFCLMTAAGPTAAQDKPVLMMATTTSTDDTGLLDYLAPHFQKATGIELRWTATGTGKALAMGSNCDVDVLLVHAPAAEIRFVDQGHGRSRQLVMYNDFIIIGPPSDPAGIKGKSTVAALAAIAAGQTLFVSRGDKSGTHQKELELWKESGAPVPEKEPWYVQTGQGMLSTINVAAEKSGYTLTDRGTYIKYEAVKGGNAPLVILNEGDALLRNQYSVIEVSPKHCDKVNVAAARRFSEWMAGDRGQALIGDFKLAGKQLFFPNAKDR
jgi:tungstate transport system substrate-binding protein